MILYEKSSPNPTQRTTLEKKIRDTLQTNLIFCKDIEDIEFKLKEFNYRKKLLESSEEFYKKLYKSLKESSSKEVDTNLKMELKLSNNMIMAFIKGVLTKVEDSIKIYKESTDLVQSLLINYSKVVESKMQGNRGKIAIEDLHYIEKIQELKFVG